MTKCVELLSPAKDVEIAKIAILAGADAVYIGADCFGARQAASNSVEDIAKLCDWAHIYGAKIYVALNTILNDAEIEDAQKLASRLHAAGVDALIVQDLGLLECGLAPIPLHASTQCHIDTPQKARMLEACGFKTLVLARELGLKEIAEISKSVDANIECFVHGALCVSYSGQCYLSHAVGGRSANRGACAQPCRMLYKIKDGNGNEIAEDAHYLCLRDMNRLENLGAMLDAGVRSFKIEGRLKDANYVKNITALYRRALDREIAARNLQRSSFGESVNRFEPDAYKTFNRGYTNYHINGTAAGAESFASPKSRGEKLGIVESSFGGGFYFRNADKIFANSDGLFFEFPNCPSKNFGVQVSGVYKEKVFIGQPNERIFVPAGAVVYRNRDIDFEKKLSLPSSRKIKLKLEFFRRDACFVLSARTLDARNISAQVCLECQFAQDALNPENAKKHLTEYFSKFGGTAFECGEIRIEATAHLGAAQANALRRQLAEKLSDNILEFHKAERSAYAPAVPKKIDFPNAPFNADWRANCLNSKSESLYKKIGFELSARAPEFTNDKMLNKTVMYTKHCVLREMGMCLKKSDNKPKLPITLESEQAILELKFDCNRCGMEVVLKGVKK